MLVGGGALRYLDDMCFARSRQARAVVVTGCLMMGSWVFLGCQDPCEALAQRICNCERTFIARRACVADRITNQQGQVVTDEADRDFCEAKLDTCSCAALDQNDLDACGFVVASEESAS